MRHLDKHEKCADISHPELSHLNREYVKEPLTFKKVAKRLDELREEYNKKIDEYNETKPSDKAPRRHMQKRAAQCFEGVLTFSPEMAGKIDINQWTKANIDFLKEEFTDKGCHLIRLSLHMDEETPHLHFIMAAKGKDGKYMAKDYLGSRGDLSALQDRYAKAMEQFDLERGHSRYNEYGNIRRRAINAGYGDKDGTITNEQVKQFAEDSGITISGRRRHISTAKWKAETAQELEFTEIEIDIATKKLEMLKSLIHTSKYSISDDYLKLIERCSKYEELIQLAKTITIKADGKEITLLKHLHDKQDELKSFARKREEAKEAARAKAKEAEDELFAELDAMFER